MISYQKTWTIITLIIIALTAVSFFLPQNQTSTDKITRYQYWYAKGAEINTYALKHARYGQIHEGKAVLLYVTEPFNNKSFVKSDKTKGDSIIPALKLNKITRFKTGIYDYSLMTSAFALFSFTEVTELKKVTTSIQDWCGQTFFQTTRGPKSWKSQSFSYFESQGDSLKENPLNYREEEIFIQARLNPKLLPVGQIDIIPSAEFLQLKRKDLKPYSAEVKFINEALGFKNDWVYQVYYPKLQRTITLKISCQFPYKILSWKDSYPDGNKGEISTSEYDLIKTELSPYWQLNKNEHALERQKIMLEGSPNFW